MELSILSLVPHIKYQSEQYIKCDDTSPGKYHQYFLPDCSNQVDTLLQLNWFYSLFVLTFGHTASSVPECRAAAAVPRPTVPAPVVTWCPCVRNLLQLHHVHGGEQRGDDHHGAQLPPPAQGDPRHARLGADGVPAVPPLAPHDVQTRQEDHQEDHHDAEEAEGAGQVC